ncbi:MAG: pyrroline-5-carboxylate reductase [Methylovirgula sp.]|uniref:pyrroline-5-carboxylate reductase n=1 Tax=Methylovirgula sp. TaxID=1978224 RepID=UPI003076654E
MTFSGGEDFPASLLLVGAGRMGGALLKGWLNLGLDPARVHVLDPALSAEMQAFCAARGVKLGAPPAPPEVLVLAIKPQTFEGAAPALAALIGHETLIVSILAGKTLVGTTAYLPGARAVVRAMPNLPAAIGAGITGVVANAAVTSQQKATAQALLEAGGAVVWLDDESSIDAVTAISGSGPAYVFYLAECLTKAGVAQGLNPDVAARLARATIEGAGALLAATPEASPAKLRTDVTSPGGTTEAALTELMGGDALADLIGRAVAAALRRAGQLSG